MVAPVVSGLFFLIDDANWSGGGSAGTYAPNRQVQMVSESVHITLCQKKVLVHATFYFKNTGAQTTVTMAFPDEGAASFGPAIQTFRSSVDGVEVPTKRVRSSTEEYGSVRYVWLKTVQFEGGQKRTVDVDYVLRAGDTSAGNFNSYQFSTGATWKGRIEKIHCVIEWPDDQRVSPPELWAQASPNLIRESPSKRLPPIQWETHRAQLDWQDIEPDFTLVFRYVAGFWNFRLNGKPLPMGGRPPLDDVMYVYKNGGDVLVDINEAGAIFSVHEDLWDAPACKRFKHRVEFIGNSTIKLGNGKIEHLRRPLVNLPMNPVYSSTDVSKHCYLKDIVEALGGRYVYDPVQDQVRITLK